MPATASVVIGCSEAVRAECAGEPPQGQSATLLAPQVLQLAPILALCLWYTRMHFVMGHNAAHGDVELG
jgi:hypothetical protein